MYSIIFETGWKYVSQVYHNKTESNRMLCQPNIIHVFWKSAQWWNLFHVKTYLPGNNTSLIQKFDSLEKTWPFDLSKLFSYILIYLDILCLYHFIIYKVVNLDQVGEPRNTIRVKAETTWRKPWCCCPPRTQVQQYHPLFGVWLITL